MPLPTDHTSPEYLAARNAALSGVDLRVLDAGDPTTPCGMDYGLRVSTRLTSDFRATWRKQSMDIKPSEVMDCLRDAGVQNWYLMGLHGYVGYLPMPRATQDVDVMVPHNQKRKAIQAISERWPELVEEEFEPVVRFYDPGELDRDGNKVPVIDLMLPWSRFQETILKEHVLEDGFTGHRYPTAEAAIVAKYAAMVSLTRKNRQEGTGRRRFTPAHRNRSSRLQHFQDPVPCRRGLGRRHRRDPPFHRLRSERKAVSGLSIEQTYKDSLNERTTHAVSFSRYGSRLRTSGNLYRLLICNEHSRARMSLGPTVAKSTTSKIIQFHR